MTQGDLNFLRSLHDAHKRVIELDVRARKQSRGEYRRRIERAEKTANAILDELMAKKG